MLNLGNDKYLEESLRNNSQKLQLQNKNRSQYSLGYKENPTR